MRKLICTCCYLGYLPLAPGTFGTLPAVALFVLAAKTRVPDVLIGAALVGACAASVWLGKWAQEEFGKKDPQPFVLDEFAGYLLAVLFLGSGHIVWKAAIAFLAFRLFDVVKPFPARRLESAPAGWGILLDDLMAGVYANFTTRIVLYLLAAKGMLGGS
jgi:phosphatidylglycerophosphatase A